MPRPIRAVFFDIDDTLYSTSAFAARARRNSIEAMIRLGLAVSPEAAYAELLEVISEFSSNDEHHYERLLSRLPEPARRACDANLLTAAAVVAYHETKARELKPFPEVHEVMEALRADGRRIGIVTAGLTVKQSEKLVRLGLPAYLPPGSITISDEVGISKPNPKLFLRACERMGVVPGGAAYVGDHPQSDIDPANRAGLLTFLVRRTAPEGVQRPEGRTAPSHVLADLRPIPDLLRRHEATG
ncbi:MAG: TIGR02253 family HAD-type hydrolase [Planctomycetes bacterium]|nr:TIGR02253 family HAD-type hydrolase [Planctomycetota bacterium]